MTCPQCKDKGFYLKIKYSGLDKIHAPVYREEIKVICTCPAGQEFSCPKDVPSPTLESSGEYLISS